MMSTGFVTDLLLVAPNANEPGTLIAAPALWGIYPVLWCDGHALEIAGNQICAFRIKTRASQGGRPLTLARAEGGVGGLLVAIADRAEIAGLRGNRVELRQAGGADTVYPCQARLPGVSY